MHVFNGIQKQRMVHVLIYAIRKHIYLIISNGAKKFTKYNTCSMLIFSCIPTNFKLLWVRRVTYNVRCILYYKT